MFSRRKGSAVIAGGLVFAALICASSPAPAQTRDRLRIPVGRAEVITSSDEVRTVAIAEPKIADAAVGSSRTVVVNGKSPGTTTLVVYNEGARYRVYDVEVFVPQSHGQVRLRVRVAEVSEKASREFGFDWFGQGSSSKLDGTLTGGIITPKITPHTPPIVLPPPGELIGPATDGFLTYAKGAGDLRLQVAWKALEESGDLRTLATPTMVALNGQEASFHAGGELPVPIAVPSGSGTTITIEWKEFGTRLKFVPTIEEDNSITLKVAPELSQLDFSNPLSLGGFTIPTVTTRKASTTVNLRGGEHLAIGGLKQTERAKVIRRVPVLGHIPILGFFFTHSSIEKVEKDLLVVVSPEIVEQASTSPLPLPTDAKEK